MTLVELQQRLQQEADLQLSIGRLWQLLRQLGLRLKKSHSTPRSATPKRTDSGGAEFIETIRTTPPERLIYLDESGVSTQMTRLYARCAGGRRIHETTAGWQMEDPHHPGPQSVHEV